MGGDKGALDLRQEDAEIFDRMFVDMLREAMPRVTFDVDFWARRMDTFTVGSEQYIRARGLHEEAKAKIEDGVRRLRRCIPSRVVPCGDEGCKGHHATFVGIA